MIVKNKVIYVKSVDDGTGSNPQEGYFFIDRMIGPFKDKAHAEMHMRV